MKRDRVRDLLLWLRKEKIQCQTVTIGDVTLDGMVDIRLADSLPKPEPAPPRQSLFAQYGAGLQAAAEETPAKDTFMPVIEDE